MHPTSELSQGKLQLRPCKASITSPTEFLVAPSRTTEMNQWEDATVALLCLASTLAKEEIDKKSTCRLPGSSDLIELLLELQAHPMHNAAVPILVPTSDRHPTLSAPVYQQLVEVILNRIAYPPTFVSWKEELILESSDFEEMRRMTEDVLIGAYHLLRSAYLETLANIVLDLNSHDWEVTRALERVVDEGAAGQTWRAFVHIALYRPCMGLRRSQTYTACRRRRIGGLALVLVRTRTVGIGAAVLEHRRRRGGDDAEH